MNQNIFTALCRTAAATALLFTVSAYGQLETPAASPHSVIVQTVGLTEVEVDYSRPSMRGRQVFGGLVPYGAVWRTGANQPTKLSFSQDALLGGKELKAGSYALYTIPGEDEWTVIIYSSTKLWGAFGYDETNDVARFSVKPVSLTESVESFTVGFDSLHNDGATLFLAWENTRVDLPLEVHTKEAVLAQIEDLKGTPEFEKPNVLFSAATFYHESGLDLDVALKWVTEACEKSETPAYWMYARKARIEYDLGEKAEAKASAEKTLELATAGGNPDYQKIAEDMLSKL